ncbi:MAG: ATP synthase subunit I [Oscillospiraceae bacterium]|nr:ATP synthase subunit I [Oscillospiraceae bacterium]
MTTKPIKKPRSQAMQITLTELQDMIPTFIICNAVVAVACSLYYIFTENWGVFTDVALLLRFAAGLLLGNAAAIGNFCLLGMKSARIIAKKNKRYAQTYATTNYFVRYIGAFALFGILIKLKVINPYTVVFPLFIPRIHYIVKALFNKN